MHDVHKNEKYTRKRTKEPLDTCNELSNAIDSHVLTAFIAITIQDAGLLCVYLWCIALSLFQPPVEYCICSLDIRYYSLIAYHIISQVVDKNETALCDMVVCLPAIAKDEKKEIH